MLTIGPFLAFQHVPVNVRNDGMCVYNTLMNVGNEGVGVHDAMMNLRNSHICIYRKFGLGMKS